MTISPTGRGGATSTNLTLDDATAIGALASVGGVAPEISTSQTIKAGTESETVTVVGTTSAYATVRAYDVWQGSFLANISNEQKLRVAVIGATTATNLGLTASSVGTQVTIGGLPFQVIGILQAKGGTGFQNPDDQVVMPVGVVQKYFVGGKSVRSIGVSVARPEEMDATSSEITTLPRSGTA